MNRTPEKLLCSCRKGNGAGSKPCQIHSDSTDNALIFSAASPAASLYRSRRGGFLCLKTSPILTYIRFFSKISNFSYNPKNSLLS